MNTNRSLIAQVTQRRIDNNKIKNTKKDPRCRELSNDTTGIVSQKTIIKINKFNHFVNIVDDIKPCANFDDCSNNSCPLLHDWDTKINEVKPCKKFDDINNSAEVEICANFDDCSNTNCKKLHDRDTSISNSQNPKPSPKLQNPKPSPKLQTSKSTSKSSSKPNNTIQQLGQNFYDNIKNYQFDEDKNHNQSSNFDDNGDFSSLKYHQQKLLDDIEILKSYQ